VKDKKKVVKHLKGDIKTFKKEAREDRDLIKKLKPKKNKANDAKALRDKASKVSSALKNKASKAAVALKDKAAKTKAKLPKSKASDAAKALKVKASKAAIALKDKASKVKAKVHNSKASNAAKALKKKASSTAIALKDKASKFKNKIEAVMHEYKEGALHSGSKKGPQVKNRKQAIAIALSEARKAVKGKKKRK
jgi:hypothetical protein